MMIQKKDDFLMSSFFVYKILTLTANFQLSIFRFQFKKSVDFLFSIKENAFAAD